MTDADAVSRISIKYRKDHAFLTGISIRIRELEYVEKGRDREYAAEGTRRAEGVAPYVFDDGISPVAGIFWPNFAIPAIENMRTEGEAHIVRYRNKQHRLL